MNGLKIYKSSAGSGKTFTLVKEYLKIVIENPGDYRHILAITFTNKATEEMKTRIVDSLVTLSEGKNERLERILHDELPDADIRSQSKKALELILHDYSGFSVCTIDSFFQKVMRALAREIHLPLRFELEMRRDEVIEAITEKLLNDVGKDKDLTDWLSDLVLQKLDDEKSWSIEGDIRFIANQLFKEESIAGEELSREKIKTVLNKLRALKKSFENKMKTFGEEAVAIITGNNLGIEDFTQKERGVAGYLFRIRKNNGADKYIPNSHVLKAADSAESWVSKSSSRRKEIIGVVESQLLKHLQQLIQFYNAESSKYFGAIEVLKKIYVLGLVNDLHKKLGEYREEKNAVMISDTPRILQSFISSDDAPFIFEKTGNRYKHFLVDEFQDTSDLQWQNLLPLITNSLGSGYFCMVVGDAKQSIYRWRGGNMNLLAREVRKELNAFEPIITEENLATNYRSKRNIIEFNNAFFSSVPPIINSHLEIKEDTLLHLVYSEELKQKVSETNTSGGYVQVQFFQDDEDGGEREIMKWKRKSLENMLAVIRDLEKKKYSAGDIAILVRNNIEGNEVADFLFENGITKILSPDSLLLARSPVILFLIHAFRFLADPSNNVARSEILYYYAVHLHGQQPEELHPVFSDHRSQKTISRKMQPANTLFDVKELDDTFFNNTLPVEFTRHLLYLGKLPVYELSEQLIKIFGLNKQPDAYIQRFLDLVLEYVAKNNSSLNGFLDWWDESETVRSCSVIIPENEDAIRIMTIHKSKGLQFPVVIMPFAEWKLMPDNRDLLWVSSEQEPFSELGTVPVTPSSRLLQTPFVESYKEEVTNSVVDNINLLYVGFTRAEDQLYIFAPVDNENDLNTTGKLISRVIRQNSTWNTDKEDGGIFKIGELQERQKKSNGKINPGVTLNNYPVQRWQDRISITTHSNVLVEMLDAPASSKINYGILVHKILSEINSRDEIEKITGKYHFEGLISEEEKKTLEKKITELLSIPEVSNFFSPQWNVRAEREIVLPGGEILRPDRVLLQGDKAVVIDFKTGKESPSHVKQVTRYAEILGEMKYTDIEKYIVYVNELRIKKIDT